METHKRQGYRGSFLARPAETAPIPARTLARRFGAGSPRRSGKRSNARFPCCV